MEKPTIEERRRLAESTDKLNKITQPRIKFCWACSGKLQGDHHIEKPVPKWSGDDIPRILHKCCSESYDEGNNQNYDVETHLEVEDVREPDEFESYGKIWV